jgi:hypothetical protein
MNERIKELAKKAGGHPNYRAFRGHFLPPPHDYIHPDTIDLEKFAELIVKECIDQVLTGPNGPAYYAVEAAMRVKKHFGVEE